jgi:transcriptional regulator with XRE-family HTH domain
LPGTGSPTVRRRELGALLRALRAEHHWTVEQVAERLLVSPSKVSRLETGQRGASQRDIRDLCDLYGVTDDRRQQLMDLAAEGKQRGWWQSRNLNYSTYVGLESEAASISDFGLGLVPGLLQTADYARAVLRSTHPAPAEEVIVQRLASRLQRQRLLVAKEPPQFEAVIDEAVLHRLPADERVMRGQLNWLIEVSEYANVEIRLLPFRAGLVASNTSKFIILTFDQPALPDTVFIEHLTGDVYLDRTEDVQPYETAFSLLRDAAATPDQTRDIIRSFAATLRD